MNPKDIHLELIPGVKLDEEPPNPAETKVTPEKPMQPEPNKAQQVSSLSSIKKEPTSMDKTTQKKLEKFSQRMNPKKKGYKRRKSTFFSPSYTFLLPFALIDDKDTIQEEEYSLPSDVGSSHQKNIITYDTSTDLENTKKLFEYPRNERNPVKQGLLNRLDQIQANQRAIDLQFKYDNEIYLKRISTLQKATQAPYDEAIFKKLEKTNKENKEVIKEFKKSIEQAEKEKIKDKKNFTSHLNEIIELKAILLSELKELEILAKNTSFQDYDEYLKDNPTKIEKLNFRPKDPRYLLTNEYETSREEEDSSSSYRKLNNINNTPDGFDITKQSNLSKTEQYFLNTKNFVGTAGNINNSNYNIDNSSNVANKNRVNHSFIINHDKKDNYNKEVEKFTLRKNETLNESKTKKNIDEMSKKENQKENNKPKNKNSVVNFSIDKKKSDAQILRNKNQENYFGKRKPSEIIKNNNIPQDPEFLNDDMILIRDMNKKNDTFY